MKIVFLDRDNTLNKDEHGYVHKPEDIELKPFVIEGLKLLKKAGFSFIIITNQSGIGRGYYTEKEFNRGNDQLIRLLKKHDIHILKTYYCQDVDNNSYNRKPNSGMIEQAIKDFHSIDIKKSFIMGDKITDVQTGTSFNISGVWLSDNNEEFFKIKKNVPNLLGITSHFLEASLMITNRDLNTKNKNKILYKKKDHLKIIQIIKEIKNKSKEFTKDITFTNGCFDIIHSGHLHYLQNITSLSNYFIIGLNSDNSIKKIKGNQRPILKETERAYLLSCLSFVDYVVIFDEETPLSLLEMIKPNYHIKGGDYKKKQLPEYNLLKSIGCEIIISPFLDAYSTSNIIKEVQKKYIDVT